MNIFEELFDKTDQSNFTRGMLEDSIENTGVWAYMPEITKGKLNMNGEHQKLTNGKVYDVIACFAKVTDDPEPHIHFYYNADDGHTFISSAYKCGHSGGSWELT